MWIGLVILEHDIVARLVLLDQVRLEDERLGLVVGDDELEIGNPRDQLLGLGIHRPGGLKVLAHTLAEALRLADIDDFTTGILVEIDSRVERQMFQFLVQSHSRNILHGAAGGLKRKNPVHSGQVLEKMVAHGIIEP